ncbi:MAG TPA: phosphate ABC transporter ATP-binding protein [Anaeromyxobacteraceae bacterium]|nr:phosphate ABC transporter ATP-binding protein [Anaeromyxobacteraceae bacterium]
MEPSADAPGMPEALLRTDRLTRVAAGRPIVDAISVEIRAGDILAVVGPSGSGKSSFLRLLNRLDEPTDGSVYLDGRDYRDLAPRDLRRRVGMVMQTPVLFPGTVADNVRYGPAQRGESVSDDSVAGILDLVGLPDFAERPVNHLSGGEAQRVAVARALANTPDVLLLDEPTSALDEAAKRGIEALVTQVVRARNLTCVVVTHDLAQAARLARRVLVIESGRLKRIGPLEEVLDAADMD